jgi:transposase
MTMTIVEAARGVTGGVDTHLDVHVAAALDPLGTLLGTERFDTDPAGYKALLTWLEGFGPLSKVGVEGTGSYGAGLARYLRRADIAVIEVDRPNRAERRRSGKSDPLDAVEAARAALGGRAHLCGVAPIPASSGKSNRHGLDRGGDRQANSALWRIVMVRIAHDPATTAYFERKVKEGHSERDVIRLLKRYVARELYRYLPRG